MQKNFILSCYWKKEKEMAGFFEMTQCLEDENRRISWKEYCFYHTMADILKKNDI